METASDSIREGSEHTDRPGRKARIADWAAILILLALPCIVYLPVTTGFATFAGFDHTGINQPLKKVAFESIRSGDLPLWEPRLDRGLPLYAEGEAGIFYPLNILFLIPGDFLTVYNIVLLLLLGAGGLLFYWWIRRLGCGPLAAFLGGVAHQWGATVNFNKANMNIMECYILAPLLMLLLESTERKDPTGEVTHPDKPWLRGVAISAVFAAMLFAGQSQYVVYTGLFALAYIVLRVLFAGKNRLRTLISMLLPFVGGAVISLGLAAVQLLPTLELIPLSERGKDALAVAFATHGLWLTPSRLFATFIFPSYHYSLDHFLPYLSTTCWVGPVAILLAGYAVRVRRRISSPVLLPLLVAGLIFLYLGMGANVPLAGEITGWGPLGHFRGHGRLTGYFALAILALMAIGLDTLLKTPCASPTEVWKKRRVFPLFAVELVLMAILTILFITYRAEYLETRIALGLLICFVMFFFAGCLIAHLIGRRAPVAVAVGLVLVMQIIGFHATSSESLLIRSQWESDLADIYTIRDESPTEDEATLIAIRTQASVRLHERVLRSGLRAFEQGSHLHIDHLGSANVGLMENLTVCNADLPLELARWEWLIHRNLWPVIDNTRGRIPERYSNLLWVLGINWMVTENGDLDFAPLEETLLKVPGFERMSDPEWTNREIPYYLYKSNYFERPYEVHWDWVAAPEGSDETAIREAFFHYLESSSVRSEVFIEGIDGRPAETDEEVSSVANQALVSGASWTGCTRYSVNVTTSDEAIFVFRDQVYPGWDVTVNGVPAELLTANLVFKAVKLPGGRHEVVFRYRPTYLALGWVVSLLSALALAGIMVWRLVIPKLKGRNDRLR